VRRKYVVVNIFGCCIIQVYRVSGKNVPLVIELQVTGSFMQ